ncbi:MAG: helix-turn-helix transcriptional regulator, partial [Ruminiclostridium sp.]|nr:helix-turn-helix transcriptional regulator [Ruminiclostridium sp.]
MKKGEKRKQELLMIAYEMFLTKGYEETSVDDMIERAQIAKGTYYHYFVSKEQMLEEVIGMMIAGEAEKARQILFKPVP